MDKQENEHPVMRLARGDSEHPLRRILSKDIHARPYGKFRTPARFTLLATVSDEHEAVSDRAHLAKLCQTCGVERPPEGIDHFSRDFGPFHLKWERHTEFSTYTFLKQGAFDHPFDDPVINAVPRDWLRAIPGKILVAGHLAVERWEGPERSLQNLSGLFNAELVTGSDVLGKRARRWTDFRIKDDGFCRMLVRDTGLDQRQAGRLVQRLFEVFVYRMMAMLAFPLARETRPKVAAAERRLSHILGQLARVEGMEVERRLLDELFVLAAEVEAISVSTTYRFSASRTYYGLVQRRIHDLREERIEGMQPSGEFLYRRLTPAMETCESVAVRLEALSNRIAHASDLLRTRVDLALEKQNQSLLQSMDRRARVQMRLQNMVEGVSTVAISYYLCSLINYVAKSVKSVGIDYNADMITGAVAPFMLITVWLAIRRIRYRITARASPGE